MMRIVKKIVLTGIALIGIGCATAVYEDYSSVNHAREARETKKPHSAFLDPPPVNPLEYYVEYSVTKLAGREMGKNLRNEDRWYMLNQIGPRYKDMTQNDVDFLLTHEDSLLARDAARELADHRDTRIIPYLMEDLKKAYNNDKNPYHYNTIAILGKMRVRDAEPLLLGIVKYEKTHFRDIMSRDAKDALIHIGGERTLQYFIANEDWDAVASFVNVNHRRQNFVHHYKDQITPVMAEKVMHGYVYRDLGCVQLMPYAAALRHLDRQQAELVEVTRNHNPITWYGTNCNQIVRDSLLGR